jgi:hypothetical protein
LQFSPFLLYSIMFYFLFRFKGGTPYASTTKDAIIYWTLGTCKEETGSIPYPRA